MGFFLPAVGAGIFGGLGFLGTSSQNDAIEQNAINQQNAINDNIENLRLSFFDTSRIAARNALSQQGRAEGNLYGNFASGHSLNRVIAAAVSDQRQDQEARRFALDRNIENLETQKRNIAQQASAQTSSPLLGALTGAIQGASLGASIDSGLNALSAASEQAEVMSGIQSALEANPTDLDALASLRALNSGVPASLFSTGGALGQAVLQPFKTQINTEAFQSGALNNTLSFQQAQTAAAQNSLFTGISQYESYRQSLYGNINFNPFNNPLLGFSR